MNWLRPFLLDLHQREVNRLFTASSEGNDSLDLVYFLIFRSDFQ